MIKGLEQFPYKERLQHLGLFVWKQGQLLGDMIQVFKITYSIEKLVRDKFLFLSRNVRIKLNVERFRAGKRKCLFTKRIV